MSSAKQYWIGFNMIKGIGAVRFQGLLNRFGDAETAWKASPEELLSSGLSQRIVENFLNLRSKIDLEKIYAQIQEKDIQVLTWDDPDYPRRLKEIDQPPPVLYVKGRIEPEDEWSVAIVGTRRITNYGRQVTEELAACLAQNGVTVVSGLARGVDAAAHQASLNAGGRTLAVLGSGVDRIYPPEHRRMAEMIIQKGAVISDYPPGAPPEATNFPPRNRIISGLSMAVAVIEAGESSGALITASFAADQGRDVFAVPGGIRAPQSIGTNRLIQKGAFPLLDMHELLESLNLTRVVEHRTARTVLPTDATEAQLFDVIGQEPLHVDEIGEKTGMPIDRVSSTLALMELKGMVRHVGGMQYVAVREVRADYQ
jgi:DNA processing protein